MMVLVSSLLQGYKKVQLPIYPFQAGAMASLFTLADDSLLLLCHLPLMLVGSGMLCYTAFEHFAVSMRCTSMSAMLRCASR